jgi:hypothetical protein
MGFSVERTARRLVRGVRQALAIAAITIALAIIAGVGLELWLRADPERMGRPLEIAQADFYPYLGIANLFPSNPYGVLEREYGYHKGWMLYQHRKPEQIAFAGDRFQEYFQLADGQTSNPDAFRIYVVGSSVAHAGNVPLPQRYFSILQRTLQAPYPIQIVSTGKGGALSTEELVIFTLSVLPNRPDMVVILDGWNDFALASILGVRPADPFNASVMYSKHYDLFYNLIRSAADRSHVARLLYQWALNRDLSANAERLRTDAGYREARLGSLVSVYLSNVRAMIDICEGLSIPVVFAPQPNPDLLLKRYGGRIQSEDAARYSRIRSRVESLPTAKYRDASFISESYERVLAHVLRSPVLARQFVDIQEAVDLDHFVDFVHQDQDGQAGLAAALAPAIQQRFPAAWTPRARDERTPAWP